MTINAVSFVVPGEPQGKGRARSTKSGRHYTPAKTVAYELLVAYSAKAAMAGSPLFEGPCYIEIECLHSVPASWSAEKRQKALDGAIRPEVTPDADNVLKAVCDGINGVVWRDDKQAVAWSGAKRYAETPCVRVRVAALGSD